MTQYRSFAAGGRRMAQVTKKLHANIANSDKDALNAAGLAAKTLVLSELHTKQPSMGFSHYNPTAPGAKGAQKFYVRYRFRKTERGSQVVIWSVPPGPQLVDRGRGNSGSVPVTAYGASSLRKKLTVGAPRRRGTSGRTKAKPWWAAAETKMAVSGKAIVRNRFGAAVSKAVK